jgi:hypothetical protein
MVIGGINHYSSYGGLVAGEFNFVRGPSATITAGYNNIAGGLAASVSGGENNLANDDFSLLP